MNIRALTDGSVTGVGTVSLSQRGGLLAGVLITADGTNDTTVVIRKNDATGRQLFKIVTKVPAFPIAPINSEGADFLYYSISGTGGAGQIYEWVP